MKYFVIGGAGFIGSVLVARLLKEKKSSVTVYDNLSSGKLKHIKQFTKLKNFNFVKGDILNLKKLTKALQGHDFVFHLAANPDIRLGTTNRRLDFEINMIGTLNVLDVMVSNNVKKIAFTSTSTVFGVPSIIPTPENYGPLLPESLYGASKLGCEAYVSAFSQMYNLKSWIFRLANITGYPSTHGIIYDFYKKVKKNPKTLEVLGDGKQKKSYISNHMLVDAMMTVIKKTMNKKTKVHLYNIGNNDWIYVREIAELFLSLNKFTRRISYTGGKSGWKGDVPIMKLDIKKIPWKPNMTSKECIIETIKKNT